MDICGLLERINYFLHNPSKPGALKKHYQLLPQSNKYFLTSFSDDTLLSNDLDSTINVLSFLFQLEGEVVEIVNL
jgi:hypothetical protein